MVSKRLVLTALLVIIIIFFTYIAVFTITTTGHTYLKFSEENYQGVKLIICGQSSSPKSVVIVIHGGPASKQTSIEYCRNFYSKLGELNITVVSLDYPANLTLVEEIEQVVKTIEFVKNRMKVDRESICVVGSSKGGYLALMSAVRENVKCVVDAYGPTDLEEMFTYARGEPASWSEWGKYYYNLITYVEENELNLTVLLKEISPIYNADKIDEDVLIMHGLRDIVVPVEHSLRLVEEFKKHGKENYELKLYEDVHGFPLLKDKVYRDLVSFLEKSLKVYG
ncbi:MAG: prolyl oligopeptidase family serine peptidase [Nitrososphaerota archaeon]